MLQIIVLFTSLHIFCTCAQTTVLRHSNYFTTTGIPLKAILHEIFVGHEYLYVNDSLRNDTPGVLTDYPEEQYPMVVRRLEGIQRFHMFTFWGTPPLHVEMEPGVEELQQTLVFCRLTPRGIDFRGSVHYTSSRSLCINWNNPLLDDQMEGITDRDFIDGSKKAARSYCRNPDNSGLPWCFRKADQETTTTLSFIRNMKPKPEKELCNIPPCYHIKCQYSGPGMEYVGALNRSIYGDCQIFNKDLPADGKFNDTTYLVEPFCRNPSYDLVGPYCYIKNPHTDGSKSQIIKSYCDVPLCEPFFDYYPNDAISYFHFPDSSKFFIYGKHDGYHTHYTLGERIHQWFNISLRLYDPEDLFHAEVRLALTSIAAPATGEEMAKWNTGFEIRLSNNSTGIIGYPAEESIFIPAPALLTGTHWANVSIEIGRGIIYIWREFDDELSYLYRFYDKTQKESILGLFNHTVQFYSVIGSTAFFKLYQTQKDCEFQVTTEKIFSRFYQFYLESENKHVRFAIRSQRNCFLLLKLSPVEQTVVDLLITLSGEGNSSLKLKIGERTSKGEVLISDKTLIEISTVGLISFEKWVFLTLSIRGESLRLVQSTRDTEVYLFDIQNVHFKALRFFAISSSGLAYWTIGCSPDHALTPDEPIFLKPELNCSLNLDGSDYIGFQAISKFGRACLPWVSGHLKEDKYDFPEGDLYEHINYCRNLIQDREASCYVYNTLENKTVSRESCTVPICQGMKPCRNLGTGIGNDFYLDTSLTGRQCKHWKSCNNKYVEMFQPLPGAAVLNLGFDIELAGNYCRNPTRDLAGPWCCIESDGVEYDLCDVPDCKQPTENTILLTENQSHKTFVKPLWRTSGFKFWLKRWDRSLTSGIEIRLDSNTRNDYFTIELGGDDGHNISLIYYPEDDQSPTKLATIAPYDLVLFDLRKWTGFHLILKKDGIILGHVGEVKPFLNRSYAKIVKENPAIDFDGSFYPIYLTFEKCNDGVLGMSFENEDDFMEIIKSEEAIGTYYPINYRITKPVYPAQELIFNFRGTGDAIIRLYTLISMGDEMKLSVGSGALYDRFLVEMTVQQGRRVALGVNRTHNRTIHEQGWSEIKLKFVEKNCTAIYNDEKLLDWVIPKPLLAYYFSIQTSGTLMWTVNREPPNIDTLPVHGGWTDWTEWDCSASCGGGRGFRTRICAMPPPSLFGLPCEGENIDFGYCNTFKCGDISTDIRETITFRLKTLSHSKALRGGLSRVYLKCYKDIIKMLQRKHPNFLIYWAKNGLPLTEPVEVQNIHGDFVYLAKVAHLNHTGVYTCTLRTPMEYYVPIMVISVIVKVDRFTHRRFRGDVFSFLCNNLVLANLYTDLEQTWIHNDVIVQKFREQYITVINEREKQLVVGDTGVWQCGIRHKKLPLKWTTNWLRLKIRPRSDIAKYLMEDNSMTSNVFSKFSSPLLVEVVFGVSVILIALATFAAVYLFLWTQKWLFDKLSTGLQNLYSRLELRDEEEYKLFLGFKEAKRRRKRKLREQLINAGVTDVSIHSSTTSSLDRYKLQRLDELIKVFKYNLNFSPKQMIHRTDSGNERIDPPEPPIFDWPVPIEETKSSTSSLNSSPSLSRPPTPVIFPTDFFQDDETHLFRKHLLSPTTSTSDRIEEESDDDSSSDEWDLLLYQKVKKTKRDKNLAYRKKLFDPNLPFPDDSSA